MKLPATQIEALVDLEAPVHDYRDSFLELSNAFWNFNMAMVYDLHVNNQVRNMASLSNPHQHVHFGSTCNLALRFRCSEEFQLKSGHPLDFISKNLPSDLFMCQVRQHCNYSSSSKEIEILMEFEFDENHLSQICKDIKAKAVSLIDKEANREIQKLLEVGSEKYLEDGK